MAFLATKRQQALQYPTLQAYASAIAFAHKIRGLTDPTSTFLFRKFMTGLRRSSNFSNPLQPVTKTMLEELISLVPKLQIDNFSKSLLRAVLSLLYHACLRISEVTVSPTTDHAIKETDLTFLVKPPRITPHALSVTLQTFKHSRSSQTIQVSESSNSSICPVTLLAQYYKVRGQNMRVFCLRSGEPLTRQKVTTWLKKLVALSSFRHLRINTHSFRIGRTTDLVLHGKVSDAYIQHVGRWSSAAYKKYIKSIVVL